MALKMDINGGKKDTCALNCESRGSVPVIVHFILLFVFQIRFQPWI